MLCMLTLTDVAAAARRAHDIACRVRVTQLMHAHQLRRQRACNSRSACSIDRHAPTRARIYITAYIFLSDVVVLIDVEFF